MIIRNVRPDDQVKIFEIWERYYKEEFDFEEFYRHFLDMFVVADNNDRIICAGGLRSIIESVIVTDKSFSVRQRKQALEMVLEADKLIGIRLGFREIHATAQNPLWESVLRKYGFCDTAGTMLSLRLGK